MPYDPKPTVHHITARTGFRFAAGWQWQTSDTPDDIESFVDVDLTGWSAELMVKRDPESDDALVAFSSDPEAGEGTISLGADGSVDLFAAVALTNEWPIGKFFYDLALIPEDEEPLPWLKGNFVIEEGVTR